MLWNGFKIAAHALEQLLDRELPDKERNRINEAVRTCNEVQGVHDLRTRHAGDRFFIEFYLEVNGRFTVERGHTICDASEAAVQQLFTETVEVTAHLEPAGIDDDRLDDRVAVAADV